MNLELRREFIEKLKANNHEISVEDYLFLDEAYCGGIDTFVEEYLCASGEDLEDVLLDLKEKCALLREAKTDEYRKQISRVLRSMTLANSLDRIEINAAHMVSKAPSETHAKCMADVLEIPELNEMLEIGEFPMLEIAEMIAQSSSEKSAENIRGLAILYGREPRYALESCRILHMASCEESEKYVIELLISKRNEPDGLQQAELIASLTDPLQIKLAYKILDDEDFMEYGNLKVATSVINSLKGAEIGDNLEYEKAKSLIKND